MPSAKIFYISLSPGPPTLIVNISWSRTFVCGVYCGISYCKLRIPGTDWSTVLRSFWHKRPTLISISQLKLCRHQFVFVSPKNITTKCTHAHHHVGKKYSLYKVSSHCIKAAGVFCCHLR